MELPEDYIQSIKNRSTFKYYLGLTVRFIKNIKYSFIRNFARLNGATIGKGVIIPFKLARKANHNLTIEDEVICETHDLDLRSEIIIKAKCVINRDVVILRVSHYIDNDTKFTTRYYPPLIIESYSWLCTGCHILPNVTRIAEGTVVSAYTTLSRNTQELDVIGSNGKQLRKHTSKFSDLVIPKLMGGDLLFYRIARR